MADRMRYVLGINCAHDAAACLMADGEVEVAISEERLTRRKHQGGVPIKAIAYCLACARVKHIEEVESIVINCYPWQDPVAHNENTFCICPKCYGGATNINPSHHLLHALYAVFASGFPESAVLVADGSGYSYAEYARRNCSHVGQPPPFHDMAEAESLYYFSGKELEIVEKRWGTWAARHFDCFRFESLGHMYSAASQFIFGDWMHAGKTMGLAPFGNKDALNLRMIEIDDEQLHVDPSWVANLERRRPGASPWKDAYCMDLAAAVQENLEKGMLFLANKLYAETRCPNLCLSGGVALNGVANARIRRETKFENVYVTPAAGDGGVAIGAAIYGSYLARSASMEGFIGKSLQDDFHGKEYTNEDVAAAVAEFSDLVRAADCRDKLASAVADIVAGKVVAWFEGRSELGPRALGHRSILADPRRDDMREHLNRNVKQREEFRPYGASVLREYAADYFDLVADDPYMLSVVSVREDRRGQIPAVCHFDGTCRIQTIDAGYRGDLKHLLARFRDQTGVPLLLNTSFNARGEPIVESPADAMNCLIDCEIDVLYIGRWRVTKAVSLEDIQQHDWSVIQPEIAPSITLTRRDSSANGKLTSASYFLTKASGFQLDLPDLQYDLLGVVNGQRNLAEIHDLLTRSRECDESQFRASIEHLRRNSVLRLRWRRRDVAS